MVSEEEAAAAVALLGKCMLARRLGPHDRADAAQEAVYRWLPWRHSHAGASPHAAIAMLLGIHRNVVRELRRARLLLSIEVVEPLAPSSVCGGGATPFDGIEQVRRWLVARGLAGDDADLLLVRCGRGMTWELAAAELGVANVAAQRKRIERFLSREDVQKSFQG
jgi:hypothetical protein